MTFDVRAVFGSGELIDVTYDFRTDTPAGADPDCRSRTLRTYHRLLWSKPLPDGTPFVLSDRVPRAYLHHQSAKGEFFLASDSVVPTFRKEKRLAGVFEQISTSVREEFLRLSYTIGGMMLFPGNKIEGKMTINGARGFCPQVKDRFDLTLECIRRHYDGGRSPLSEVLNRYYAFFALFETFHGFVDFFLLNDFVSADYSSVHFASAFDDFSGSPVPATVDAYEKYRRHMSSLLAARNERIQAWCCSRLPTTSLGAAR